MLHCAKKHEKLFNSALLLVSLCFLLAKANCLLAIVYQSDIRMLFISLSNPQLEADKLNV